MGNPTDFDTPGIALCVARYVYGFWRTTEYPVADLDEAKNRVRDLLMAYPGHLHAVVEDANGNEIAEYDGTVGAWWYFAEA